MKRDIHPEYTDTTVTCNGCSNKFETRSTTDKIDVEICAQCHPFYTGKQKLVDVAGRVDRFRARQAAAGEKPAPKKNTPDAKAAKPKKSLSDLKE